MDNLVKGSLSLRKALRLLLLLPLGLVDKGLVDVRDHTTSGDGSLDELVKLLISTNSKLKVTRSDTLHFKILGGISRKFENFGAQVFQDGRTVHGSSCTNTVVGLHALLQETVNTTDRELQAGAGRPGDGRAFASLGLSFSSL